MPPESETHPIATSSASKPSPFARLVSTYLLPLFFVILFPLSFVSALHNPHPHDLNLLVVGSHAVAGPIADKLDRTTEFTATSTDETSEARSSVKERRADGAILIEPADPGTTPSDAPSFTVTVFVANAAGQSLAKAVESVGETIAAQLNTTPAVRDVAPLKGKDPLGVSLFYLMIYTSLGAYLVIIILMQVLPRASLAIRYGCIAIASVAAPVIVFGLSSIFVGDYGASFGTIVGLLALDALYVFTVGAAAILIEQLLGKAATFGIMAFVVFLNFPSSGGASPGPMLPPFWQAIHNVYFGSGAFESFRSIVYFDGNGLSRWLLQLLAWAAGLVLVTVIVQLTKAVLSQRKTIAELSAAQPLTSATEDGAGDDLEPKTEHLHFDDISATGTDQRRAIGAGTAGER